MRTALSIALILLGVTVIVAWGQFGYFVGVGGCFALAGVLMFAQEMQRRRATRIAARDLADTHVMRSIKFRGSKLESSGLLVAFCAVLGLAGTMVIAVLPSSNLHFGRTIVPIVMAGFLMLAGVPGLYIAALQLVRSGAIVTMDQQGVLDVRNGLGLISWADIRSVQMMRRRFWIGSKYGIDYLAIFLSNPAPYLLRLPAWKRHLTRLGLRLGMPFAQISFLGLTPGAAEAAAFLREASGLSRPG
jgi:hypothetical protein